MKCSAIYHFISSFFIALWATLFFLPLSLMIPKKNGRITVIGRERGTFSDNAKHIFLFLHEHTAAAFSCIFLTSSHKTMAQLRQYSLPCLFYPSCKGAYWLLTSEFVLMDSAEWIHGGKFQLSRASKTIQLWHGAPLKEIELPLFRRRLEKLPVALRFLLKIQKKIIGRYPQYYALLSTSDYFTRKAFSTSFKAKHFLDFGYPRNDSIFKARKDSKQHSSLWINCDQQAMERVKEARTDRQTIILYAPTFRSDLSPPFAENILSLQTLNTFSKNNNFLFIMKLHPLMANQIHGEDFSHICHYNPKSDIYPALPLMDCLVTDYSSIYFDYLLLDRPILFFAYDLQHYRQDERNLLFEYQKMAPGTICNNQQELFNALLELTEDPWQTERKKVRNRVFDYVDDKAGARILEFLESTSAIQKGSDTTVASNNQPHPN